MKHGGQQDEATFGKYYQPNNSGTDGQNSYLGGELRSIVSDLFRGMTISRNPELCQSLPAEKQHALESTPEFVSIEKELETLGSNGRADPAVRDRRRVLSAQKRKLTADALRTYQKQQSNKFSPMESRSDLMERPRTIFSRVRHLMPERDRLASSLFSIAPIRSAEGREVLRDMIALYRQETEVACCPGLEPEKCGCAVADEKRNLDRYLTSLYPRTALAMADAKVPVPYSRTAAERWKHIYGCYKKRLMMGHGFAEMCFRCSKWIIGKETWNEHCEEHLRRADALPVQCDYFVYGGALASPGYCAFCLGDTGLPATLRMRQFLDRGRWRDHVDKHLECLDETKAVSCPHPASKCAKPFESVQALQFHLQDVHCIELNKRSKRNRPQEGSTDSHRAKRAKYSSSPSDTNIKAETFSHQTYLFVDETKILERRSARTSDASSVSSAPTVDRGIEDLASGTQTPVSSVSSDLLDKIDPRLLEEREAMQQKPASP